MNYIDFCKNVSDGMNEYLEGRGHVEMVPVLKNNGVVLDALVIKSKGSRVSPTFYFEDFYENYKKGDSFQDVMNSIIRSYELHNGFTIDLDFFTDFDKVKDRIIFKLVHAGLNEKLLKDCPYTLWNDLAMVYCYLLDSSDMGSATVVIRNKHLEIWGKKKEDIFEIAQQNMPRLLPEEMLSMRDMLFGMMKERGDIKEDDINAAPEVAIADKLYVLSNSSRYFGASSMLYSNRLPELSRQMGCGLYILPSSIHEVIVMPESECDDESYMKQMITEVNACEVGATERLSDNLYYYDPDIERIRIVAV